MKKLWIALAVIMVGSFAVLGWIGTRIYQEMPPIPDRIVDYRRQRRRSDGDIGRGQNVWQAMGGMEVGSIWGHGSYVAPDWTADWLHREAGFVLNEWAVRNSRRLTSARRRRSGQAARPSGTDLPPQRLRCRHQHHPHRSRARPRLRGLPRALLRCLHERQCRLRDPLGQRLHAPSACGSSPASSSGPPGRPPRTAPATPSPTPTTGPTSRWSAIGPPARPSCGPE